MWGGSLAAGLPDLPQSPAPTLELVVVGLAQRQAVGLGVVAAALGQADYVVRDDAIRAPADRTAPAGLRQHRGPEALRVGPAAPPRRAVAAPRRRRVALAVGAAGQLAARQARAQGHGGDATPWPDSGPNVPPTPSARCGKRAPATTSVSRRLQRFRVDRRPASFSPARHGMQEVGGSSPPSSTSRKVPHVGAFRHLGIVSMDTTCGPVMAQTPPWLRPWPCPARGRGRPVGRRCPRSRRRGGDP
jgi:hypothetical protein